MMQLSHVRRIAARCLSLLHAGHGARERSPSKVAWANMRMPCACWKFCVAIQHFRQISGMFWTDLDSVRSLRLSCSFRHTASVLLPQEVEDVKRTCVAMGLCQLHCCSRLLKKAACHYHTAKNCCSLEPEPKAWSFNF